MSPFISPWPAHVPHIGGIRIVASEAMPTNTVEDWTEVRSPSRAARRRRQGHRQRIIYRQEPRREILYAEAQNLMFMHPVVLREFQAALKRREATNDYWAAVKKALLDVGCRQAAASMGARV
ncbi:hypothetical protein ACXR8U_14025 [Methylobacterium radiotolerans]|jgi:hypothetical protein|uniref:hypothetical protein n=1 Tax=Methylobacterium TaxID=407 RepID=UPI0005E87FB3|nr:MULTISPECIES: hypothetical protein [Methylobacterium]MBN6821705.1 hypothetical protein [Methylobacterium organophilum]OXE40301.1 hypothetical protein CCS92_19900 [Methylobacterium radiotolerans]GAN49653.1 sugar fermentation stimulation protein homolog [Methylobacterium sp. ME121]